jgi:hypothetical protein
MKFLIILVGLIPLLLSAKEFEGSISYSIEYEITDARLKGRDLQKELGSGYVKFYTPTETLAKYDIGIIEQYNPTEKKTRIREMNGKNLIGNVTTDSVRIIQMYDIPSQEVGLGCPLDALRVEYSDSTYTEFYYCKQMKIAPSFYKDYVLSGYNQIFERIKSVPLIIFRKSYVYNTVTIAYEKSESKVDQSLFNYPADIKWEVSPDF